MKNVVDVWHRLVQLPQEAPTIGSIRPMVDSPFAADLEYKELKTIRLLLKSSAPPVLELTSDFGVSHMYIERIRSQKGTKKCTV